MITNINNNKYFQNLLHPEKNKGVKIPSSVPVPSCSFQLHNSFELPSVNQHGNLVLLFNPFFLANKNDNYDNIETSRFYNVEYTERTKQFIGGIELKRIMTTSLFVNNNDSMKGDNSDDHFVIYDAGQSIQPIYNQYRLVSASIVIKYIGKAEEACGTISGSILFNKTNMIGAKYNLNAVIKENGQDFYMIVSSNYVNEFKDYANYNNIKNTYYFQENTCLEGLRMLYFPLDNAYYEYNKVIDNSNISVIVDVPDIFQTPVPKIEPTISRIDSNTNGFYFIVYIQGFQNHDSPCFRMDTYCNFECLPNPQYQNCLPITISNEHVSKKEEKEAIIYIQKKPIFKFNEK